MALTEEQKRLRDGRLTASRVACLMTGDERKILNLWHEMVGSPDYEPEDLDHYWPAVLGSFTEPLNLDWYGYRTGHQVTRRGEVVICPQAEWAAATLDGWDDSLSCAIECKHVGGREPRQTVIDRYQPQFHWIMRVTGTREIAFSPIEGTREPLPQMIPWDEEYGEELWLRAEWFMNHVWSLTPPVEIAPIPAPIIPTKELCMDGISNSWPEHAATWLEDLAAAKRHATATEELKTLAPKEYARVYGSKIVLTRNKAGAATIKELRS